MVKKLILGTHKLKIFLIIFVAQALAIVDQLDCILHLLVLACTHCQLMLHCKALTWGVISSPSHMVSIVLENQSFGCVTTISLAVLKNQSYNYKSITG